MNPIKVLHIGKYYPPAPGGIENFLKDIVTVQIESGMDVRVIAHDNKDYKQNSSLNESFIKKVPTFGQFLYAPVSPGFKKEIQKNLRKFKPDIIHLHMPNTSVFWLLFIKEASTIPWVIHWHADVVFSKINKLLSLAYNFYKPFETKMLKQAGSIIVTSPSYLETSHALLPFKNKCEVLQLGINPQRFLQGDKLKTEWANDFWGKNHEKKVLSVGRLAYYKGFHNLINAFKYVNNMKLVIVGEGEQKKHLSDLIKKNELENKVTITGFLPEDKLFALFDTCDVFCLPSVERTEAFGLVLLESLVYKKHFVASDVEGSGMSWISEKTGAGVLFRHDSVSSLVMALNEIFDNSLSVTKNAISNALKGLPDDFNIRYVSDSIGKLYKRLLEAK